MDIHKQVADSLGLKSNAFSKCQAKACIADQLYQLRVGDIPELGTGEDPNQVNQEQDAKLLNKDGHIQVSSGEKSITEQLVSNVEKAEEVKKVRLTEEKPLTKLISQRMKEIFNDPENKGISKDDILEAQIRANSNLPADKELMEKY